MVSRLRVWAERWKPAAGVRVHLVAAAVLWTVVGLGLMAAGVAWCARSRLPWSLALAAAGLTAGLVKGRYVIRRLAEKNAARIIERGDGRCLGGFLSGKTWLLVAVMMASGMALRRSSMPRAVLGVIYSAVGTALLAGSLILWRVQRRREG